jgi:Fe-S-cluster containining protein
LVDATGRDAHEIVGFIPTSQVDLCGEPGSLVLLENSERALLALEQRARACIFLGSDARCGAYAARPASCRLFPFDPSFGRRGGIRRLRLLGGSNCDHARDGHNDPHALREADAQRWDEQRAYQLQVQNWNRSQNHRARFGRRLLGSAAFLRFLGFVP